jgi:hypothetical protein
MPHWNSAHAATPRIIETPKRVGNLTTPPYLERSSPMVRAARGIYHFSTHLRN